MARSWGFTRPRADTCPPRSSRTSGCHGRPPKRQPAKATATRSDNLRPNRRSSTHSSRYSRNGMPVAVPSVQSSGSSSRYNDAKRARTLGHASTRQSSGSPELRPIFHASTRPWVAPGPTTAYIRCVDSRPPTPRPPSTVGRRSRRHPGGRVARSSGLPSARAWAPSGRRTPGSLPPSRPRGPGGREESAPHTSPAARPPREGASEAEPRR